MASDAEVVRRTDEIPQWKYQEVATLVDLLNRYESVGVVGFTGIPSKQLQNMRRELHGSAELRVSRNTMLRLALEEADTDLTSLLPYVSDQVGLVATDDNPFGLYRQLEASKTPAPINAGEITPKDIVLEAGDTGVDPGPFVGELQQVGADARIQDGSIKITSTSTVAEAGDDVSETLAGVLAELEIEPKEVGLDLRAVYSDGILFEAEELAIDIDEYQSDFATAVAQARNLSVNAVYPTAQTAPLLIRTANREATSVGLAAAIENPTLVPKLIARADGQVRQLARQIDDEDALPPALRDLAASEPAPEADEDESIPDEDAPADDAEDEDEDDEEDGDGAAGLGAMFG